MGLKEITRSPVKAESSDRYAGSCMLKHRQVMKVLYFLFSLCVVPMLACSNASAQEQGTGSVSGKLLTKDGKPMSGGLAYFLSADGPAPDPEKYWRVPEYLVEITDKGTFSLELPEGSYYFGAIKKREGKTESGPPQAGDVFYRDLDTKGNLKVHVVRKGKKLKLGTMTAGRPFLGLVGKDAVSAIEGRVITSDGGPVAGALVFVYLSEEMKGKPAFASYRTGIDGRYLVRVHEGGNFYLRVRDHYGGGQPEPGDLMGVYGGEVPSVVSVRTGESTTGRDITVERFKGRGQQYQQGGPP